MPVAHPDGSRGSGPVPSDATDRTNLVIKSIKRLGFV
jgi:hypothetical protein